MNKKTFFEEMESLPNGKDLKFQLVCSALAVGALMAVVLFVGWLEQFFY